jgi:HEAT repeat protein
MTEHDPFASPPAGDPLDNPLPPAAGDADPFGGGDVPGGGYLGGNDDDEVRKINRRVSPVGKILAVLVLGAVGGAGYFAVESAREQSAQETARTEGNAALQRLLNETTDRTQLPAKVRELYERYKASDEVRMACRRLMASLHDTSSVPLLIEGLRRRGNERRQAALALAEIGLPAAASAKDALMNALPDTDERLDRADVTWALVVLQEGRAWEMVVKMLSEGKLQQVRDLENRPFFDPALVSRLAGRDRLIQLATDTTGTPQQQTARKRIAASALSEMATPETFEILSRLSTDSDVEVATLAAIGLGRTGDARGAQPVLRFLNAQPDQRERVLNTLAQNSGAPGLAVIGRDATDITTRKMAVRLLQELQDPAAGDALFAIANSIPPTTTDVNLQEIRVKAIFGLADIGDPRAAEGLLEIAKKPIGAPFDANHDMEAKQAIDKLIRIPGAAARVKAGLLEILPRADFMRTQVLLALGAAEDPSIGAQVARYLTDEQAQEGAARAVARLHYAPGIQILKAQIRRPPNVRMNEQTIANEALYIKRRNAIRGLAWSNDPTLAPDLMRIVEDSADEPRLREDAGNTLATVADDAALQQVATRAMDTTKPVDVRRFYMLALRARSTPQIATQLVSAYIKPGEDSFLMRFAAIAAGLGGDDATALALTPLLASRDANVRLNAGIAAVLLGGERLTTALLDSLIANTDFGALITPEFVTRGSQTGGPTMMEPLDLMPLTEAMFTNGAIYRRINSALQLERGRGSSRYDFAIQWLRGRLKSGWDHPLGISAYAVRAKLREAVMGTDAARRETALRAFRSLNDRGSLLFLRRQTGDGAELARRALLDMNSGSN